ncbi:hypothetical protein VTJ49DRAFT_5947 [Mycothermus thermophilus]|uniref:Adenine DNA glycosylase n=1 Tax=Humicola insolens TaxID=85995 RepID=A0ABR3VBY3_HUMIN
MPNATEIESNTRPTKRLKTISGLTLPPHPPGTDPTAPQEAHLPPHSRSSPPGPSTPPPPDTTTNQPSPIPTASLPSRIHPPSYHVPLLLTSPPSRTALLQWFTTHYHRRAMPWRKPFVPPTSMSRRDLSRRAYEVWISEVMLQQTRVSPALAERWTRWMERWPSLGDLARASEQEVLAEWAGLGYYQRARRVWLAAREVWERTEREEGVGTEPVLPGSVEELIKLPGVGRYTAGAVAAIVFGVPAPMVDGNVLRVMSRQMGLHGDVNRDAKVGAVIWKAAEELVKVVAADGEEEVNERPGLWGQALMELGSTVCTPKPNCGECPITATCRVYQEGLVLAGKADGSGVGDIEDVCTMCAPLETEDSTRNEGLLSRFFAAPPTGRRKFPEPGPPDPEILDIIIKHARRFPRREPAKTVREEEMVVCAIRSSDGQFLIHRRPDEGLLAGMWELPTQILPESNDSVMRTRKSAASSFVRDLIAAWTGKRPGWKSLKHIGEIAHVVWPFSHLKHTMHVQWLEWNGAASSLSPGPTYRWASVEEIDGETMGSGMKRCWEQVRREETRED